MAVKLKAGSIDDFSGSMAKAMVNAFRAEWPKVMGEDSEPPEMTEEMKLLFVAIARGVVDHLVAREAAFQLEFVPQSHLHTYGSILNPHNTDATAISLPTGIHIEKE